MLATVAEVAEYLGWTEGKLRNRIQRKKGHPPYVIADDMRTIEFRREDVLEWYAKLPTVRPEDADRVPRRSRRSGATWPIRAGQPVAAR